jgi:hypothetical protein
MKNTSNKTESRKQKAEIVRVGGWESEQRRSSEAATSNAEVEREKARSERPKVGIPKPHPSRTIEPARASIKRPAPVEVMIDHPTLGRVKALHFPAIPGSYICPEHGLRCQNWRRKRCERMMRKAISTDLLRRLIYASPEQFAAVERVLGIKAEPKVDLPN